MKKWIKVSLWIVISLIITGCTSSKTTQSNEDVIKIAVTLDPHSKIVEFAKPLLEQKGYQVEIIVLDNYYIFNESLNSKEIDANFFQHVPFFTSEVEENGYEIVNAGGIHIEPLGFYSKKITEKSELKDGAEIVISNSISDQGRILSILDQEGIIDLSDDVDAMSATINDIVNNPKNLKFIEVNPELLTTVFEQKEGDLVAINGNYALQAGLNPIEDSVILEEANENNPYVNIVAVQSGTENSQKIQDLMDILQSQEVKEFIKENYADGSVIPVQ